jgi:transposase-like protein
MPWEECRKMDEKLRFAARHLDGESISSLCREFGISRVTGHKIIVLGMYRRELASPEGLEPPTSDLEGRCSIQLSYGLRDPKNSRCGGPELTPTQPERHTEIQQHS